jgi:hypothetical protein
MEPGCSKNYTQLICSDERHVSPIFFMFDKNTIYGLIMCLSILEIFDDGTRKFVSLEEEALKDGDP